MISNQHTYLLQRLLLALAIISYAVIPSGVVYSQEPPPYFNVVFENDSIASDSLLTTYQFQGFMYTVSRVKKDHNIPKSIMNHTVMQSGQGFVDVLVYGENYMRFPNKGDLIHLRVDNKRDTTQMNIIIRVSYDLTYGEKITLKNARFVEGTYFMDMCNSGSKYGIPTGHRFESEIDIRTIENHLVVPKKLKKIIKKHKCSDVNDE